MTNLAHVMETALLVFAAYLAGCIIGYAAHRILHAARVTRKAPIAIPAVATLQPPQPARPRTPAARLVATSSHDGVPAPAAPKSTAVVAPPKKVKPKPTDPRPVALTEPRSPQADNLKQIKGIGPKIEASLNVLGIFHVDQIADWSKANIDWIDSQLAFKGRIRRERWVEQAIELGKVKT